MINGAQFLNKKIQFKNYSCNFVVKIASDLKKHVALS
jgi:hypothetical protein